MKDDEVDSNEVTKKLEAVGVAYSGCISEEAKSFFTCQSDQLEEIYGMITEMSKTKDISAALGEIFKGGMQGVNLVADLSNDETRKDMQKDIDALLTVGTSLFTLMTSFEGFESQLATDVATAMGEIWCVNPKVWSIKMESEEYRQAFNDVKELVARMFTDYNITDIDVEKEWTFPEGLEETLDEYFDSLANFTVCATESKYSYLTIQEPSVKFSTPFPVVTTDVNTSALAAFIKGDCKGEGGSYYPEIKINTLPVEMFLLKVAIDNQETLNDFKNLFNVEGLQKVVPHVLSLITKVFPPVCEAISTARQASTILTDENCGNIDQYEALLQASLDWLIPGHPLAEDCKIGNAYFDWFNYNGGSRANYYMQVNANLKLGEDEFITNEQFKTFKSYLVEFADLFTDIEDTFKKVADDCDEARTTQPRTPEPTTSGGNADPPTNVAAKQSLSTVVLLTSAFGFMML
jgi:hypothetical protein